MEVAGASGAGMGGGQVAAKQTAAKHFAGAVWCRVGNQAPWQLAINLSQRHSLFVFFKPTRDRRLLLLRVYANPRTHNAWPRAISHLRLQLPLQVQVYALCGFLLRTGSMHVAPTRRTWPERTLSMHFWFLATQNQAQLGPLRWLWFPLIFAHIFCTHCEFFVWQGEGSYCFLHRKNKRFAVLFLYFSL